MRLCGGERVVAVADGKDEIRLHTVKSSHLICMIFEFSDHFVRVKSPSRQMTTVHVEVEVIEFFQLMSLFVVRLDDVLIAVVDEEYDVRQLHRRVLPYGETRGDAVGNDALRRADGRLRGMDVGIFLQVHGSDDAEAGVAVGGLPLDEDEAVFEGAEHSARQIVQHGLIDVLYPLLGVAVLKVDLGEDELERAGRVSHLAREFVPIVPLGSELIAGNHREFFGLLDLGQQYVERLYRFHCILP